MFAIQRQGVLAKLEDETGKEKVEVVVVQGAAEMSPLLEIRSLRWGRGVGWYVEKTIQIKGSQVNRLAILLRRFTLRAKGQGGRKIIPLPVKQ